MILKSLKKSSLTSSPKINFCRGRLRNLFITISIFDVGVLLIILVVFSIPVRQPTSIISSIYDMDISSIHVGEWHSCVLMKNNHEMKCFGKKRQLGVGYTSEEEVVPNSTESSQESLDDIELIQMSLGLWHTCLITNELQNNLYCWGSNTYGQQRLIMTNYQNHVMYQFIKLFLLFVSRQGNIIRAQSR